MASIVLDSVRKKVDNSLQIPTKLSRSKGKIM